MRMRNGVSRQQVQTPAANGVSSGKGPRSGQEVAELRQQIQQLSQAVQTLTEKMNSAQ